MFVGSPGLPGPGFPMQQAVCETQWRGAEGWRERVPHPRHHRDALWGSEHTGNPRVLSSATPPPRVLVGQFVHCLVQPLPARGRGCMRFSL